MLHILLALLRPVFASPEAEATVRQPVWLAEHGAQEEGDRARMQAPVLGDVLSQF